MSLSDLAATLQSTTADLPELPARLFWLRAFGLQSSVSWDTFLAAFLLDYQGKGACVEGTAISRPVAAGAGTGAGTGADGMDVREDNSGGGDSFLCSEVIDSLRKALAEVMKQQHQQQGAVCVQGGEEHEIKVGSEPSKEEEDTEHVVKREGDTDQGDKHDKDHEVKRSDSSVQGEKRREVCLHESQSQTQTQSQGSGVTSPPPPPPPVATTGQHEHEHDQEHEDEEGDEGQCDGFAISRAGFAAFCEG